MFDNKFQLNSWKTNHLSHFWKYLIWEAHHQTFLSHTLWLYLQDFQLISCVFQQAWAACNLENKNSLLKKSWNMKIKQIKLKVDDELEWFFQANLNQSYQQHFFCNFVNDKRNETSTNRWEIQAAQIIYVSYSDIIFWTFW